jgi:hypothetical protein
MGVEVSIKNNDKIVTKKYNKLVVQSNVIPFLPVLPKGWYYEPKFYNYVRNVVRAEHNLFKIEWSLLSILRLPHHSILVKTFDECTNDILECVKSIKDVILMEESSEIDQERALILLRGDIGECVLSNFYDVSGFTNETEYDFIREWYDRDPVYVVCSILKCYDDSGNFDKCKMSRAVRTRFKSRPYQLRKIKRIVSH